MNRTSGILVIYSENLIQIGCFLKLRNKARRPFMNTVYTDVAVVYCWNVNLRPRDYTARSEVCSSNSTWVSLNRAITFCTYLAQWGSECALVRGRFHQRRCNCQYHSAERSIYLSRIVQGPTCWEKSVAETVPIHLRIHKQSRIRRHWTQKTTSRRQSLSYHTELYMTVLRLRCAARSLEGGLQHCTQDNSSRKVISDVTDDVVTMWLWL